MEQIPGIFEKISAEVGVMTAVVIVGLAVLYWRALNRIDTLVDRHNELTSMTANAMSAIANQMEIAKVRGGKDD